MNTPLSSPAEVRDRKAEHIRLALDESLQGPGPSPFDDWRFEHNALPEIDFAEIDTSVDFLGKRLGAPLLISAMTGGTELARRINENLARGAEARRVALAVGSQRKALEDRDQVASFTVRALAPSIPLLANLGAVQLNYGFGVDECRAAVEMIRADALVLHLNVLQEALQPEGQTNFARLLPAIASIVPRLTVPVVVKEVGAGLSADVARRLTGIGVHVLDTAGQGGTNWVRIEAQRSGDVPLGELFADWGIPTPDSIRAVASVPGVTVIGSGGLRSGLDVAKAIALGASLAGLAFPFLQPATESSDQVAATIDRIVRELKIAMLAVGARSIAELQRTPVHRRSLR
jgi:isopentenyl-diphosphate delta-isomerase